ncbi:hypothetical protein ACSQ67_007915 [Phaseolus vulgaris]
MHCVYGFRSIPFMAVPRGYNFVSFIAFLLSSGSLAFSVLEDILSSISSEPVIYLKTLPEWKTSGSNDEDHISDTMSQPKENVQSVEWYVLVARLLGGFGSFKMPLHLRNM